MKRPAEPDPRWRIVHIGKRGETLTIVRAPDAQAALETYCRDREVDEREQTRLIAVPLE